jgi:hypothetical protein
MRISAWALLLTAGCAGAQHTPPPASACTGYEKAMRGPLAHMFRAADAFSEAITRGPDAAAEASGELAARLDADRAVLIAVSADRSDIAAAHGDLVAAVAGLADAVRFLGDVLAHRDESRRAEARTRLGAAVTRWQESADRVKRICPDAALPP